MSILVRYTLLFPALYKVYKHVFASVYACLPPCKHALHLASDQYCIYVYIYVAYPELSLSHQKTVHKVDNVLMLNLLHHNNLVNNQFLQSGGREREIWKKAS